MFQWLFIAAIIYYFYSKSPYRLVREDKEDAIIRYKEKKDKKTKPDEEEDTEDIDYEEIKD